MKLKWNTLKEPIKDRKVIIADTETTRYSIWKVLTPITRQYEYKLWETDQTTLTWLEILITNQSNLIGTYKSIKEAIRSCQKHYNSIQPNIQINQYLCFVTQQIKETT